MTTFIVPIYPPEIFKIPEVADAIKRGAIPSPISIEHSLIPCGRCNQQGWIGPKQRKVVEAEIGEAVCMRCIAEDGEIDGAPMVCLNPDIDQVPRRLP